MMFEGVLTSSSIGIEKAKNRSETTIPTTMEATMLMAYAFLILSWSPAP